MNILLGILLTAGLAAIGLGLGAISDYNGPLGFCTTAAGFAIVAAIFIWLPGFMERREARRKQADIERAEAIAERIALTGSPFEIRRRASGLILALLLSAIAGLILHTNVGTPTTKGFLFGGLFVVAALIAWLDVIPRLSRPDLSFTREGIQSAMYGFFLWENIAGLDLFVHDGGLSFRRLELSIPNINALRSQMHPCGRLYRWFAFGYSRFVLRLGLSNSNAVLAHHLAVTLWNRKTARRNTYVARNYPKMRDLVKRHREERRRDRP